jgi:MFS family permease
MIQGIGTTAYESLSVAAIGDMFFLHQRGLRTALLVLTLACLSSFVAIIAGTGFQHLGARNLFVMLLPIQIFGTLGTFFFIHETQFRRDQTAATTSNTETTREKPSGTVTEEGISNVAASPIPKRSFVQDLRLTSGTYNEDGAFKLLGEIFVHLLNPAVIWIQIVSAVLIVSIRIHHISIRI